MGLISYLGPVAVTCPDCGAVQKSIVQIPMFKSDRGNEPSAIGDVVEEASAVDLALVEGNSQDPCKACGFEREWPVALVFVRGELCGAVVMPRASEIPFSESLGYSSAFFALKPRTPVDPSLKGWTFAR